jgi:hypothetical protein
MNNDDRSNDTVYNIGQPGDGDAEKFVTDKWPDAKHEGVGYWRIPRTAHLFYNGNNSDANGWFATIRYRPMGR